MAAERDEEVLDNNAIPNGELIVAPKPLRDKQGRLLPGAVLNPRGRRNDQVARLSDVLRHVTPSDVWRVFTALHEKALDGDVRAAELYLAYCLGKPIQRNEFSGTDGVPFVLTIVPRLEPPPTTIIDPDDEH
jgi:hypothetical protein